jgi:hypothetical protein
MSGLEVLELSRDDLTDISLLANLRNLTYLNLSNNRIGNISLLAKIPSLEYVDVSANPVYDLTPLSKLPNLQRLIISKDNKYYRMVDFLKKQNKELIVREVTPDESLVRHNYCREPEDYCVLNPNEFAYSLPRDKGYRGTFQKAKPEQRPSIFSRIFGGNKIMDFVNSAPKPKRRTYY